MRWQFLIPSLAGKVRHLSTAPVVGSTDGMVVLPVELALSVVLFAEGNVPEGRRVGVLLGANVE